MSSNPPDPSGPPLPADQVLAAVRPFRAMQEQTVPWNKRTVPGSPANYWLLDYDTINNMQWTVTQKDTRIPVFPEPHACVQGVVAEIIQEQDGDTHIWLTMDGTTKGRFACEITPQDKLPAPQVGQRITVYGIFRYDLQHSWPEIHPVDHWEPA